MVMQHQLQSMAGTVTHLDRDCRYRKEFTLRILIRALRAFERSYYQDHGMDRRLRSLIVSCGYSNHSSDNERSRLLGPGQLSEEARGLISRIRNGLIASIPKIIAKIRDYVSQTPIMLIFMVLCRSLTPSLL